MKNLICDLNSIEIHCSGKGSYLNLRNIISGNYGTDWEDFNDCWNYPDICRTDYLFRRQQVWLAGPFTRRYQYCKK
jgi:hypothetical protein